MEDGLLQLPEGDTELTDEALLSLLGMDDEENNEDIDQPIEMGENYKFDISQIEEIDPQFAEASFYQGLDLKVSRELEEPEIDNEDILFASSDIEIHSDSQKIQQVLSTDKNKLNIPDVWNDTEDSEEDFIAFSDDEKPIVNEIKREIDNWEKDLKGSINLEDFNLEEFLKKPTSFHPIPGIPTSISVSPDMYSVVIGTKSGRVFRIPTKNLIDVEERDPIRLVEGLEVGRVQGKITSVGVNYENSADGRIAIGTQKGEICVLSKNGKQLCNSKVFMGPVLTSSLDNDDIVAVAEDQQVVFAHPNSAKVTQRKAGHEQKILAIDHSRLPELLATASIDGSIRLWKLEVNSHLIFSIPNITPSAIAVLDSNHLVVGTEQGYLYLLNTSLKKAICRMSVSTETNDNITRIITLKDDLGVAFTRFGYALLFQIVDSKFVPKTISKLQFPGKLGDIVTGIVVDSIKIGVYLLLVISPEPKTSRMFTTSVQGGIALFDLSK